MQNVDKDPEAQQPAQPAGELVPAKNGVLRDPVTGRIVAHQPGGATSCITPANASALAESRWQTQFAASRRRIRDVSHAKTSLEAFSVLTGSLYRAAMNDKNALRDRVMAAKYVGSATDLLPPARQAGADSSQAGVTVAFSPEVTARLVQLLADNLDKRNA